MSKKIIICFLSLVLVITMTFSNAESANARQVSPVTSSEAERQSVAYVCDLEDGKIYNTRTNSQVYNNVAYLYPGDSLSYKKYIKTETFSHNNSYCWQEPCYGTERTVTTVYSGLVFEMAGSTDVTVGSNNEGETVTPQYVTDGVLGTKAYDTTKTISPKSGYVLKVFPKGGFETRENSGFQCPLGKALDEYNVCIGYKMYVQTYQLDTISGLPATITKDKGAEPFTITGTTASGGSLGFEIVDNKNNAITLEKVGNTTAKITVKDYGTAKIKVTSYGSETYMGYSVWIPVTIAAHSHSGGTATCKTRAVCTSCGEEYGELAPHTLITSKTPASQTADGKIENKCSVCNASAETKTIYAASTVKLATTKYSYDGKNKKPAVTIKDSKGNTISASNYTVTYDPAAKKVGKYTVKISFKEDYTGSKNLSFVINPAKTSLSKLTAAKKAFTAKWAKKTAEVTGYELQYSSSSAFKSGNKAVKISSAKTTSKAIKNLAAGKKYYVRIRTYKTVGKTTYYSDWSASKSVTTKKK